MNYAKKNFLKKCKIGVVSTVLVTALSFGAFVGENQVWASQRSDDAANTMQQLYNNPNQIILENDKELNAIVQKLIYADVNQQVKMPLAQQELLTLVVLTANNTPEDIPLHVQGALNAGATPIQIRESIFHCAAYVGISRAKPALEAMYKTFKKVGVKLPLKNCTTVTDENRHEVGLAVQKSIFGPHIDEMNASAPQDQKHINTNLSANCFGDYYTRDGLTVQERELVTFTAIISLGGCDPQAKAHVNGNLSVGNTRQQLLDAVTIALPYIGYPRTLNAIAAINAIVPAEKK